MALDKISDPQLSQWNTFKLLMAEQGLGELPEPDASTWQRHSNLVCKIMDQINASEIKAISFAAYMQRALYEPGTGYYSSGLRKFGEQGDFVTAPELSPLFGACIANQIEEVFLSLKQQKEEIAILEFGPGSGALCVSVMTALDEKNSLPDVYYMLEVSASLGEVQQLKIEREIPALAHRVKWVDCLPENITGVVLANEVLDAMPFERFKIDKGDVNSLSVATAEGLLVDKMVPAEFELKIAVDNIEQSIGEKLPEAYTSEINLWIEPWIKSLAEVLGQGLVLLIDYGYPRSEYYHEQRSCGTLMCHYRQRAHDNPLLLTGLQDITAFVDFTSVAEAADNYGLEVAGFTNQAQFLMGCGLEGLLQLGESELDKAYRQKIQQVKWLTLPSEMGDRFKVMALTKGIDASLSSFSIADFMHRL